MGRDDDWDVDWREEGRGAQPFRRPESWEEVETPGGRQPAWGDDGDGVADRPLPSRGTARQAGDDDDWGFADVPNGQGGRASRMPSGPDAEATGDVVQAPIALLVGAVLAPLLAVALLAFKGPSVNALGWAIAIFGSLGLVLAFTSRDLRASASVQYGGTAAQAPLLRLAAVALGIAVAAVHAWFFADWASRLDMFAVT